MTSIILRKLFMRLKFLTFFKGLNMDKLIRLSKFRGWGMSSKGKFLFTKIGFGGSFGMSLEGDFYEVVVTPNLELLVTFGMSLVAVCHELFT
jgi:hypothetical protein